MQSFELCSLRAIAIEQNFQMKKKIWMFKLLLETVNKDSSNENQSIFKWVRQLIDVQRSIIIIISDVIDICYCLPFSFFRRKIE